MYFVSRQEQTAVVFLLIAVEMPLLLQLALLPWQPLQSNHSINCTALRDRSTSLTTSFKLHTKVHVWLKLHWSSIRSGFVWICSTTCHGLVDPDQVEPMGPLRLSEKNN